MDNQILVSVLMTAYNREKYIAEAIDSVLASSFTDFELIIVDDCSDDSTVKIARSFALNDRRVNVYVNEKNLGDYNNRNKAASYARGKYLKYLDSDDIIYPWGLEAMVMCMEKFPEAGFGLMSYGLPQKTSYPIIVKPEEGYRAFFFKSSLIAMGPSGAIFRKEAFEEVNGFSGKPYVGDTEMWLKLARIYPLVRMPLDLIWWREHGEQQIKEEIKDNNQAVIRYILTKEALTHPDCPLSKEESAMALRNLQNLQVRKIITEKLLKIKLSKANQLLKEFDLGWSNLFKGLKKNKYPLIIISFVYMIS